MKFVCVSTHPENLAHGQVVGPGEEVTLTREQISDPENAVLLNPEERKFLAMSKQGEEAVQKAFAKANKENEAVAEEQIPGVIRNDQQEGVNP